MSPELAREATRQRSSEIRPKPGRIGRVCISGIGLVSPFGYTAEDLWSAVVGRRSGIRPITRFDVSKYPVKIAGEIPDFEPASFKIPQALLKKTSRGIQFSLVASKLAIKDARLEAGEISSDAAVVFGTSTFPPDVYERGVSRLLRRGLKSITPRTLLSILPSSAAGYVSVHFKLKGSSETMIAGCVGGIQALGTAYKKIRHGETRTVLAGAFDTPLSPFPFALLCRANLLSSNPNPDTAVRPFDVDRNGEATAEGCAVFLIEESGQISGRSRGPYCEIVGYGSTADGWDMEDSDPSGQGLVRAFQQAFASADMGPGEVDLVLAHASGFQKNDAAEVEALKKVFSKNRVLPPVVSIKGVTGQPLSVGGLYQVIVGMLAIKNRVIPPTKNCVKQPPTDPFDHVIDGPRKAQKLKTVAVVSYGYGGSNAVLLLRTPDA